MKLPYPLPTYLPPLSIYSLPYLIRMPYFKHVLTYSTFLSQFSASFSSITIPLPRPMAKFDENLLHEYFLEMIGIMPEVFRNFRTYMMEKGGAKKSERFLQLSEILKKNSELRLIENRELEENQRKDCQNSLNKRNLRTKDENEQNNEKNEILKTSFIELQMIIQNLLEGEENLTKIIIRIGKSKWFNILKNSASTFEEKKNLANVFLKLNLSGISFRVRNKLLAEIFYFDPENVGTAFFSQMNLKEFLSLTQIDPKKALSVLNFLNIFYAEKKKRGRSIKDKNFLPENLLPALMEYNKEILNILSDEKKYKKLFRRFPSSLVKDIVCYLVLTQRKTTVSKDVFFNLGVLRLKFGKDFITDKHLLEISKTLSEDIKVVIDFFEPELKDLSIRASDEIKNGKPNLLYQYSSMTKIETYVKSYHKKLMEKLLHFLQKKSKKISKKYNSVEKIMKSLSFLQIRIEENIYKDMTSAILEENKFVRDFFLLNCFPEILKMVKSQQELLSNRFSLISNILFFNYGSVFHVFNQEEREKYLKQMLYFSQIAMHANVLQLNQNIDKIIEVLRANINGSPEYMAFKNHAQYFVTKNRYFMIFKQNPLKEAPFFSKKSKRRFEYFSSLPERDITHFLTKNSIQFEREVQIAGFYVDFVIKNKLIIEYFGLSHFYFDEYEKVFRQIDQARIKILQNVGFKVIIITCYQWKKYKKESEREQFLLNIIKENLK